MTDGMHRMPASTSYPTYNIKPINICYIQLIMIIILLSTPKLEEIIWFVSICACLFVYKLLPELLHPYSQSFIISQSVQCSNAGPFVHFLCCGRDAAGIGSSHHYTYTNT